MNEKQLQLLRELNHPRIPRYLDAFETADGFAMVWEYQPLPSLREMYPLTPAQIKQIALSVLEIILGMENSIPPIIHGDITPENILVDEGLNAYLINFCARLPLGEATDLYSLGTSLNESLHLNDRDPRLSDVKAQLVVENDGTKCGYPLYNSSRGL
ncbi:MAG: protein kinase family protein [Prochloron sp. SP5CPC1]|nr:protein kinase family protein [Candidatus Paraprochloron terpiosi SP5CPC1]